MKHATTLLPMLGQNFRQNKQLVCATPPLPEASLLVYQQVLTFTVRRQPCVQYPHEDLAYHTQQRDAPVVEWVSYVSYIYDWYKYYFIVKN